MTDEQIIKALECCIHKGGIINCEPCPVGKEFGYQTCEHILTIQCNGLINRQKAEIERIQHYKQSYDELKAEHLELIRSIKTCQIEAIKEFAEKLILGIQRHLMPNVEEDGTVTVENAERYFISKIKEAVGDSDA